MKRISCVIVAGVLLSLVGSAGARSYSWTPYQNDLWDLDHSKYYICRITDFSLAQNEEISLARLTIKAINNWDNNANILYMHLMSGDDFYKLSFSHNIATRTDSQNLVDNLNYWSGIFLKSYTDLKGGDHGDKPDFEYDFTADQRDTLESYCADSLWGLGFDPDCHFFNEGISLQIETTTPGPPVPEPVTFLGMLGGLVGLGGYLRRRIVG